MSEAVDAEIRAVAKLNVRPYTIANEVMAARPGQALGLPIPAGVVAEHAGKPCYLSLDVSKEGKARPPIVAADFVRSEPNIAAGAVVFDSRIANNDRHARNMSHDPSFARPRPALFDHAMR